MEGVESNVKSLFFTSFCAHERSCFIYEKCTTAVLRLLFLGLVKEIPKLLHSLATVLDVERKLYFSVDESLLLLSKSKINYFPSEYLKEGLLTGLTLSNYVKTCRVTPLVLQQFYFLISNTGSIGCNPCK